MYKYNNDRTTVYTPETHIDALSSVRMGHPLRQARKGGTTKGNPLSKATPGNPLESSLVASTTGHRFLEATGYPLRATSSRGKAQRHISQAKPIATPLGIPSFKIKTTGVLNGVNEMKGGVQ
jgi:hypothetical protein